MTVTSYGVGQYRAGEAHALFRPRMYAPGSKAGVIHCHGYSADYTGLTSQYLYQYSDEPTALAKLGFPSIAADLGLTPGNFGNAVADAAMDNALTYLRGAGLAHPAKKIGLVGGSMGCTTALNWTRTHKASVAAVALLIPAVDVEDLRANNRGPGLQAPIEAAYGGNAGWQAARPQRNPIEFAAEIQDIPIHIWYSSDDTVILPDRIMAFAAAHGNTEVTSMGPVGHTAFVLDGMDLAWWLEGYLT